ncbi:ribokinase [Aneurinibacillus danicus]|uniref:Ribokinase n=1 Tax=Aneurinibacillus danicus TaxID=267746 RepID=A0A511V198_9BACL|nr:ribokinase [Aneurinibacillus danicus]GEN32665.1 ribokinase [Aneurinibacillus danicus]
MKRPKIVVVGSINMDLITETPRVPALGETVLGNRFSTLPGGKGANQAVACARLGAEVRMVGCVGDDGFGTELIENLRREGVCVDDVEPVPHVATGIASIVVENGDNSIIVVPGANHEVTVEKVRRAEQMIREADAVLLQLEIPLETVAETVRIASRHHVPVIVNPAPAVELQADILREITILTPNEYELAVLLGKHPEETEDFRSLIEAYPGTLVMTKGGDGAYYSDGEKRVAHQPGYKVEVVDTTGAGDTFNAALAVMIGRGRTLSEAVQYAVAASALSVTKFGAQGGMPSHEQVEAFLAQTGE